MKRWDTIRQARSRLARPHARPGPDELRQDRRGLGPVLGQRRSHNAVFQWNGDNYTAFDTGRPNAILVDPATPTCLLRGLRWRGVETFNFVTAAPDPTWIPVTDASPPSTSRHGMTQEPDVLYIGTGDPSTPRGRAIMKAPTAAAPGRAGGAHRDYGFQSYRPTSIRDIRVDPSDSSNIWWPPWPVCSARRTAARPSSGSTCPTA